MTKGGGGGEKSQKIDDVFYEQPPAIKYAYFRNPDESLGGLMVLGGSDPEYYEGEFSYVDVVEPDYWRISMDG